MNKAELLDWLKEKHREWEDLVEQIDPARMEESGVAGHWSMKDVIAHLVGWNRHNANKIAAAQRGDPEPTPHWPAGLESDDEVNAWFYEHNHARPVSELLADERQVFQEIVDAVEAFPDDVEVETVHHEGRDYYLLHWEGQRLQPGEFFDHFGDDHEADIRAWMNLEGDAQV